MKEILTAVMFTMCGFTSLNLVANEAKKPYVIQRGDKTFVVNDMPKFTKSSPIENSFVYIAGEYIDPPYVVSISNLAIYINERIVNDYAPLVRTPSSPPLIPEERPVLPEGISKETDMYDERVRGFVRDMYFYLQGEKEFNTEEKTEAMLSIYQSLPNIKNVERDMRNPVYLNLTYQDGKTVRVRIQSFTRRPAYTLENVGSNVDSEYESWVRRLQTGEVIKFVRTGGGYSSARSEDGDGGALILLDLARKVEHGDEKAREALINAFKLGESVPDFHPNWIERLANNTNLETRATKILEAKREREKQEEKK